MEENINRSMMLLNASLTNGELESSDYTTSYLLILVAIIVLTGNSLVLLTVKRFPKRLVADIFIFSLALLDVTHTLTSVVLAIVFKFMSLHRNKEAKQVFRVLCQTQGWFTVTTQLQSAFIVTMITLERFIAVSRPFLYKSYIKPRAAFKSLAFFLVVSIGLSSTPLFGWGEYLPLPKLALCMFNYHSNYAILIVVIGYADLILVSYCFIAIRSSLGKFMKRQTYFVRRRGAIAGPQMEKEPSSSKLTKDGAKCIEQSKRLLKVSAMVSFLFYFSWLPLMAAITFAQLTHRTSNIFSLIATLMPLTSAVMNPLVYFFTLERYKRSYIKIVQSFLHCWPYQRSTERKDLTKVPGRNSTIRNLVRNSGLMGRLELVECEEDACEEVSTPSPQANSHSSPFAETTDLHGSNVDDWGNPQPDTPNDPRQSPDDLRRSSDHLRRTFDDQRRYSDELRRSPDHLRRRSDDQKPSSDELRRSSEQLRKTLDDQRRSFDDLRRSSEQLRRTFDGQRRSSDELRQLPDHQRRSSDDLRRSREDITETGFSRVLEAPSSKNEGIRRHTIGEFPVNSTRNSYHDATFLRNTVFCRQDIYGEQSTIRSEREMEELMPSGGVGILSHDRVRWDRGNRNRTPRDSGFKSYRKPKRQYSRHNRSQTEDWTRIDAFDRISQKIPKAENLGKNRSSPFRVPDFLENKIDKDVLSEHCVITQRIQEYITALVDDDEFQGSQKNRNLCQRDRVTVPRKLPRKENMHIRTGRLSATTKKKSMREKRVRLSIRRVNSRHLDNKRMTRNFSGEILRNISRIEDDKNFSESFPNCSEKKPTISENQKDEQQSSAQGEMHEHIAKEKDTLIWAYL